MAAAHPTSLVLHADSRDCRGSGSDDDAQASAGDNPPSCNLLVNHVPLHATDDELRDHFAAVGVVVSARVMRHLKSRRPAKASDRDPTGRLLRRSKGFGFVLMATVEQAQSAVCRLHNSDWDGKCLSVQFAQGEPDLERVQARLNQHQPQQQQQQQARGGRQLRGPKLHDAAMLPPAQMPLESYHGHADHQSRRVRAPRGATAAPPKRSPLALALGSHHHPAAVSPQQPPAPRQGRTILLHGVDLRASMVDVVRVLEAFGLILSTARHGMAVEVTFESPHAATAAAQAMHLAIEPRLSADVLTVTFAAAGRQHQHHPQQNFQHPHQQFAAAAVEPHGAVAGPYSPLGSQRGSFHHTPLPSAVEARQHHLMPHASPLAEAFSRHAHSHNHHQYESSPPSTPVHALAPTKPTTMHGAAPRQTATLPAHNPLFHQGAASRTTIALYNMPIDADQCRRCLELLLRDYGALASWECWGNGVALATFATQHAAERAVASLRQSPYAAAFCGALASEPPRDESWGQSNLLANFL